MMCDNDNRKPLEDTRETRTPSDTLGHEMNPIQFNLGPSGIQIDIPAVGQLQRLRSVKHL